MASNETVRRALLEMGVDSAKALHASQRYETPEAAINWVFGEGESWAPDDGGWVQEMEVMPSPPARHTSPVEDTPGDGPIILGSNNPFLSIGSAESKPPVPRRPEERSERERSVRASAPPPDGEEEGEIIGPLFGPSDKEDKEGKLAVTVSAPDTSNKEEEDFQRAIQESMMTASFQSDTPQQSLPLPVEREADAPVVYVTTAQPVFGAHFLQALAAVPQIRDVVAGLGARPDDEQGFETLRSLMGLQSSDSGGFTDSYTLVDNEISALQDRRYIPRSVLPPDAASKDAWLEEIETTLRKALDTRNEADDLINLNTEDINPAFRDYMENPIALLATVLRSAPDPRRYVAIFRAVSEPSTIHDQLAKVMWAPDAPPESLDVLADVVFVSLHRTPGIAAPKWQFDYEVVLDRYLTQNAAWAMQERAGQGVIQGELRRVKERIDSLTTFRGQNLPDALKVLEKQLSVSDDEAKTELKSKLERVSEAIASRLASLQHEAQEKEEQLKTTSFETDDLARLQHKYRIRAILWHDGFNTPGSHLYAYTRHNDIWWRIADTTATKVDWASIESDNTGQFTDGGPYMIVYSREGPRPPPPVPEPSPTASGSSIPEELDGSSIEPMDISPRPLSPSETPSSAEPEVKAPRPLPQPPVRQAVPDLIDLTQSDTPPPV